MSLRSGHGRGAGVPRIEVLPPDELPKPVAANVVPISGVERRQNGTVASSEAARTLGRRGGLVKAKRVKLARSLGLAADVVLAPGFEPYRRFASNFRRQHSAALAQQAGGEVGLAPLTMIASAALQVAASRFLYAQAAQSGDAGVFKAASQLANDSRQNLLAAYELAVREANARSKASGKAATMTTRVLGPGEWGGSA